MYIHMYTYNLHRFDSIKNIISSIFFGLSRQVFRQKIHQQRPLICSAWSWTWSGFRSSWSSRTWHPGRQESQIRGIRGPRVGWFKIYRPGLDSMWWNWGWYGRMIYFHDISGYEHGKLHMCYEQMNETNIQIELQRTTAPSRVLQSVVMIRMWLGQFFRWLSVLVLKKNMDLGNMIRIW